MRVHFTGSAWEEFLSWREDAEVCTKLVALIEEIRRNPFSGTGKPEPLKGPLSGWWSRRITREDRLVYAVEGKGIEQRVVIARCREHY